MALPAPTMRRLAFIKFLYMQAQQQAQLADFHASASLLAFHDAVEMFLHLGCEYKGAALAARPTFEQYWQPLAAALGVTVLPEAVAMRRLNAARVGLKHQGLIPSKVDMEGYSLTVASFFSSATSDVFGVDFDRVSMIDFVEPQECRDLLIAAEGLRDSGNFSMAAAKLSRAFKKMISHYAEDSSGYRKSVFDFHQSLSQAMWSLNSRSGVSRQVTQELQRALSTTLEPMQSALLILGLGLDFRRYANFQALMPTVRYTDNGEIGQIIGGDQLTKQDLDSCMNYVIDSAIILASPA
jgi:hypothetical protein